LYRLLHFSPSYYFIDCHLTMDSNE